VKEAINDITGNTAHATPDVATCDAAEYINGF
jgi:hypothetical protein